MAYNLREKVEHIGYITNQIVAPNRLPTVRQVLAVLFYNLRRLSNSLDNSAKLTIDECIIFWKKARIPTQEAKKCVSKLKHEYEKWRNIRKHASRTTDTQKKNEATYEKNLNHLFDIAKADALALMEDENDKQFLLRERGNIYFKFVVLSDKWRRHTESWRAAAEMKTNAMN